jgi:hypothetical protein
VSNYIFEKKNSLVLLGIYTVPLAQIHAGLGYMEAMKAAVVQWEVRQKHAHSRRRGKKNRKRTLFFIWTGLTKTV